LPEGNGYILDAGMNIEDASELLKVELPEGESDTLGGFIYDQLGKVPVVGEKVEHGGFVFEVLTVNDRRILKVKVTHAPSQTNAQQATQEQSRAADDATEAEHKRLSNAVNKAAAG
ncbi:MAG: transporter associated domain-containing protein, partial [Anaerolineae bacterium]|nr:transporter associated domain-containing protein [Anaerolineae bacterium]